MKLEIDSSSIHSLESTLVMFPCQLLLGYRHFLSNRMAGRYMCTFKSDGSCRAQLLMEHSYPFSHYCLFCVSSTRPEDTHQGVCVCVCVCIIWPITEAALVLTNTCSILRSDMKASCPQSSRCHQMWMQTKPEETRLAQASLLCQSSRAHFHLGP